MGLKYSNNQVAICGGQIMFIIFKAIYFALCFAMAFLGLIIAIHLNAALGLTMFALFIVKFFLMIPQTMEA